MPRGRPPKSAARVSDADGNLSSISGADVESVLLSESDEAGADPTAPGGTAERRGRGRPRNARGATPAELAGTLSKLIGGSSVLLALVVGADEVAMTTAEARAIADPAARMLARAEWAKKLSRSIATGSDAIDLAFALAMYGLRIAPVVAAKAAEQQRERQANVAHPRPSQGVRAAQPAAPVAGNPAPAGAGDANAAYAAVAGAGFADPFATQNGHYTDVAGAYRALTGQ